eukprot:CAMPEP_0115526460 /NCGR_PEP_ID=MMETSP0271-20121206/82308_1 /TAXON_ID=71861 /ORGANISM="Scrippsiella trochoidea, Strain CCMP3099" /LENGTH=75 /DNA_ID=CAMNT_0002958193 /DNA_START=46 /DNA_END=271 /DNA_ORIENTATION=+
MVVDAATELGDVYAAAVPMSWWSNFETFGKLCCCIASHKGPLSCSSPEKGCVLDESACARDPTAAATAWMWLLPR